MTITKNKASAFDATAIKDLDCEHPIALAWRPIFREIVSTIVSGHFGPGTSLRRVAPISPETAKFIEVYIADYGETLAQLPEDAWATSVAQWMDGHWDALIDLWTVESGASDLVLAARVNEASDGF